jgi:hypothetical protein
MGSRPSAYRYEACKDGLEFGTGLSLAIELLLTKLLPSSSAYQRGQNGRMLSTLPKSFGKVARAMP